MTSRHGHPNQADCDIRKPLNRSEKLRKIRELIQLNQLPVWADPDFPYWTPPKAARTDVLDAHQQRQKELKEFRDWYLARDHGQYAARRQAGREKQEALAQLHYDQMQIPARRHELQHVLLKDAAEERLAYHDYLKTTTSELETMRTKTEALNNKHEKEQREFVQKQYERQWKNSTSAEQLRNLEAQAHKLQAARDLGEVMFFKLLGDLEDYEVDRCFVQLGLDRAARERQAMNEEDRKHKEFEVRGQAEVLAQMRAHMLAKKNAKQQKAVDLTERLHFEERSRFDAFKEAYEAQQRMEECANDLVGQKNSNYIGLQQNLKLKKEADEAEAWMKQVKEEAEAEILAQAKSKAIQHQRHLDQDSYNTALVAASHNDAVEKYAEKYLKAQQLDALFNYLDYTKSKQSLQSRINKELENQVRARDKHISTGAQFKVVPKALPHPVDAEKRAEVAGKQEERNQMDAEKELARIRTQEEAAKKLASQQQTSRILKRQMSEKEERTRKEKDASRNWSDNFEKQRAIEEAYIKELGNNLLFAR